MKTSNLVTIVGVVVVATAIVALYLASISGDATRQNIGHYDTACEPIACMRVPGGSYERQR